MSKQTKPPVIESAIAMLDTIIPDDSFDGHDNDHKLAMVQTVLMVRAIDRLTAAVRDNTKAIRDAGDLGDTEFVDADGSRVP